MDVPEKVGQNFNGPKKKSSQTGPREGTYKGFGGEGEQVEGRWRI